MIFRILSDYLTKLSSTSSRIEITKILASLYKELDADEASKATYLLTGALAPRYQSIVFNIADNMIIEAIAASSGGDTEKVKKNYKETGDLGETTEILIKSTSNSKLTVSAVYQNLIDIAVDEGKDSVGRKIEKTAKLLSELDPASAKYVVRMMLGRLRLGFSDKTIIDSLSWMEYGDKSGSKDLLRAYEVVPDSGLLAHQVKKFGLKETAKHIKPKIGIPVMPMLAARLKSPTEMIAKMGEVAVEPKFDGLRVLIHFSKPKKILKAFTRNLNDISEMFPELNKISEHINAEEIILDSEVVGLDIEQKKIADFQTTMQRRRKHDISEMQNKIPVTFQVFDILYKDGESFMNEPYKKRREILSTTIKNGQLLKVDESIITKDPQVIAQKYTEMRRRGLEGIIVKKTESTYVPGRLGYRWVKMKEAEEATGKLSDTVDAVIMGFTSGQGKRASFGIGQFLAGIISGDKILTITKVGTGLTDEQFRELNKRLQLIKLAEKPENYEVHKNLAPDFWVKPEIVVELAADDITVSPNHTAGYALRFPRLVKFRDDKSVKEATTLSEIKKLFKLQKK